MVQNAIEASESGSKIRVVIASNENELGICVEDNGDGIEPENRHKIFDAFFTTRFERNASGLGLTICRRILSNADGRIELEQSHKPTRFLVSLKCEQAEQSHA